MQLDGLKVAVLVTDGYEPSELTEPIRALREAGAEPTIVSDHDGQIKGKTDADTATVDVTLDVARPEDYAALVLPGGVKNPDTMRQNRRGVAFVRHFADAGTQNTGGECSPAVVSQGNVTITCIGLDPRQQETLRKMPGLIDELLKRSQSDRDEILAKLEEILKLQKPRRLTTKQSADFVKVLRALPNGAINLGFTSGSADDGFNLAQQLLPLFKEAGWTVRNEAGISNHLEIQVIGVGILTRSPTGQDHTSPPPGYITLTPTLATLREAFWAVGIDVQFINWQSGKDDAPEVVVGSRPQP